MANGVVFEVGQEEMSRDIGSTILRSKQDTRGTFASLANEFTSALPSDGTSLVIHVSVFVVKRSC